MEMFAIALSIPAWYVCGTCYSWLLMIFVWRFPVLRRPIWFVSLAALALAVIEVHLLVMIGAVAARRTFGSVFLILHSVVLLTTVPAVASLLTLRSSKPRWWEGLLVGAACAFCGALLLAVFLYGVDDAWYGVDGTGGPFGKQF